MSSDSSGYEQVRELPQRATRGKRMSALMDEEEEADQEFWGQDFFAEEAEDVDFASSATEEEEDVPDSDFDEAEEDDDEEGDKDEPERVRRKALKPPGAPKRQARPPGEASKEPRSPAEPRLRKPAGPLAETTFEAPTLRQSTRARVVEAEQLRKKNQQKPKRRVRLDPEQYRPLTQEELLAAAAKTEIENSKSLQVMLAREEALQKKATVKKAKYVGPLLRFRSRRTADGNETVVEVVNMRELPVEMRARRAPPPAPRSLCVITGLPVKYRHPATGEPYATLAAYRELQRRHTSRQAGGQAGAGAGPLTSASNTPPAFSAHRRPIRPTAKAEEALFALGKRQRSSPAASPAAAATPLPPAVAPAYGSISRPHTAPPQPRRPQAAAPPVAASAPLHMAGAGLLLHAGSSGPTTAAALPTSAAAAAAQHPSIPAIQGQAAHAQHMQAPRSALPSATRPSQSAAGGSALPAAVAQAARMLGPPHSAQQQQQQQQLFHSGAMPAAATQHDP